MTAEIGKEMAAEARRIRQRRAAIGKALYDLHARIEILKLSPTNEQLESECAKLELLKAELRAINEGRRDRDSAVLH